MAGKLEDRVKEIIVEQLGVNPEQVTTDASFIDDLGAEVSNQFTVSTIYNVLNSRISTGLPTVISTNLNQNELNSRYWDRITSRILGEFRPLLFSGSDVRKLKLTE